MHSRVKFEQCFSVINTKMVAVFQASIKLVWEWVGAKLTNMNNKHSALMDQTVHVKEDAANRKHTFI